MTSTLLVALGAALGAPVRYLASLAWDHVWPTGTWLVNVAGSAALGLFLSMSLDGCWWALLATGFCGGLTSYSAFAVQAVDLPRARSLTYVLATVVGTLLACLAGFSLGRTSEWSSAPAEIVQSHVIEPEVVRDLVDDRDLHLGHQFVQ